MEDVNNIFLTEAEVQDKIIRAQQLFAELQKLNIELAPYLPDEEEDEEIKDEEMKDEIDELINEIDDCNVYDDCENKPDNMYLGSTKYNDWHDTEEGICARIERIKQPGIFIEYEVIKDVIKGENDTDLVHKKLGQFILSHDYAHRMCPCSRSHHDD